MTLTFRPRGRDASRNDAGSDRRPAAARRMVWGSLVLLGAVFWLLSDLGQRGVIPGLSIEAQAQAQPQENTPATDEAGAATALVLRIEGGIGPAQALYVREALKEAGGRYRLVVLEMDTPGGLDTSMREIISAIIASPVPVATYVSPTGSRAASAGTYILYGSHIAAMAPSTTLGAATPVQVGGGGGGGGGDDDNGSQSFAERLRSAFAQETEDKETGTDGQSGQDSQPTPESDSEDAKDANPSDQSSNAALRRKVVNDAAAYIRGLANLRGRNADWAERAVREAVSLTSEEAVEINVIDLIAQDLPDLFEKINGRSVRMAGGQDQVLDTTGLTVERRDQTWVQQLLGFITNPAIALVLMQLGVLGLIIELYNPGAIFPGVVGVICLLLGLTALAVLPISVGGLALVIAGMLFIGLELFVASGGILAVAGVIAFGFGAFFLFDTDVPEFRLSLTYVLVTTAIMGAFVLMVVSYALAIQRRQVVSGREAIIGQTALVLSWSGTTGKVRVDGEVWSARSDTPLREGQEAVVLHVDGLTVILRPKTS